MKKFFFLLVVFLTGAIAFAQQDDEMASPKINTTDGMLQGLNESGLRIFKGIPFAQPPVGELRWKEPQPVKHWDGVRNADRFGPRAMQLPIYSDMNFRSDSVSEDCLYLNVWTPAKSGKEMLPVLVYFYGGGLMAGDGSEFRYDGESMARRGIVAITVNYRLSVFGFLAHPELTKESPHHASGNYGFLDQYAALVWVNRNIKAFGGDPEKVTIAGESAGSFSVCALMASPLSKPLIRGAIGESGSLLGLQPTAELAVAEKAGSSFGASLGANSLAALRMLPASQILKATASAGYGRFPVCIDGYFFPKSPLEIYISGEQAKVPLLVGWNSEEGNWRFVLGGNQPTKENFVKAIQKMYGDHAEEGIKAYYVTGDADVESVGTDLGSDLFIGFSTWRWSDLQTQTGGSKVYRYFYAHPRPGTRQPQKSPVPIGAVHSSEIEYALGNLPTNRVFDWQPDDYEVSAILQTYFANFIKTGDPNGLGVPDWPANTRDKKIEVMHVNVNSMAEPDKTRQRYLFLELTAKK